MKKLNLPFKKSIPTKDIVYLQSDSNYTQIYLKDKGGKVMAAKSLMHIHEQINMPEFIRINRSQVINKRFVASTTTEQNYSILKLKDGSTFKTSRRRTEQFLNAI